MARALLEEHRQGAGQVVIVADGCKHGFGTRKVWNGGNPAFVCKKCDRIIGYEEKTPRVIISMKKQEV